MASRKPMRTTTKERLYQSITEHASLGDPKAPFGSVPWAVSIRNDIQDSIRDTTKNAARLNNLFNLMREHKGYLCLHKKNGDLFMSLEEFCVEPEPWGLGYDLDVINRIIKERLEWQRKNRLEQVPEDGRVDNGANRQPGDARFHSVTDSGHDVPNQSDALDKANKRIRAINRAPEPIRELYQKNLIGEVEASKLGALNPSDEKQKQINHITTKIESLPLPSTPKEKREFKRRANAIVKKTLNILDFKIMDDPDKAAKALIKRFQGDRLRRLIKLLEQYSTEQPENKN